MRKGRICIRGLRGIPEIRPGDSLADRILEALEREQATESAASSAPENRYGLSEGAVFVVAQKVVSKSEGALVALDTIVPSAQARDWAVQYSRDARMVEVILRHARRIVRMDRGVLIVETHHGFICANAGVDSSNAPTGTVVLLPADPDASARRLRDRLQEILGLRLAVIISDTFGRPWRQGQTNVALGVAGLTPIVDYRGQRDSYGRRLHATLLAAADEIAAAAELVMGKTLGIPVAIIEGYQYDPSEGSGSDLLRPPEEDLFR